MSRDLIVVGLGPGDPKHLTAEAVQLLKGAKEIYVRTRKHPTVSHLPAGAAVRSFDHLYEELDSFDRIYEEIARTLLQAAEEKRPRRPVVYAVPGSPLVGEESVALLRRLSTEQGVPVTIVQGLSFIEPVLQAVGADPLSEGLQVLDALRLASATEKRPWEARNVVNATQPCLIAQIHSRRVASHVKIALLEVYPPDHEVVLAAAAGVSGDEKVMRSPLHLLDRQDLAIEHMACLFVPALPAEEDVTSFRGLERVVARLRGPNGCPWDREQTHQSLKPFLMEESYEVLEALDAVTPEKLSEELGDLLLQIVLHAELAAETGDFHMGHVLSGITTKLIRRHPHVFASGSARTAAEVVRTWEQIKRDERAAEGDNAQQQPKSALSGVPAGMPALAMAQELQRRAARVGFDWPNAEGVLGKVAEEIGELRETTDPARREEELGDLLFTVVNLARWMGSDAEGALRLANRKFRSRMEKVEQLAHQKAVRLQDLDLVQLDSLWEEAKASERHSA